jgi:hypothetical protein
MKRFLSPWIGLCFLLAVAVGAYVYHSKTGIALRNRYYTPPLEFQQILAHFQWLQRQYEHDPPLLPVVYKGESAADFKIELAPHPLGLRKREVVMRNPFAAAPYPLSFSVIYQGNLVTLFQPGYFACYQLPGLERNQELEQKLNTRKFAYHWVLDGQLVALTNNGRYVSFNQVTWLPYTKPMPLSKQPKLFEDARYIVCAKCNGEWGGEVYFYDKQERAYFLAEATCPDAVVKHDGKYLVLSSLGHGLGSTELQQIDNPAELTRWIGKSKPQDRDFFASYGTKLSHGKNLFDYQEILVESVFQLDDQLVYLVHWDKMSFLATWQNNTFQVVDPLFHAEVHGNQPVTTTYGPSEVLINLDSTEEFESSCLVITGIEAVKINWSTRTVSAAYTNPAVLAMSDSSFQVVDSIEVELVE